MLADLVRKRLKKIAVDANLHDWYGVEYPSAVKASKERKKLLALLVKLGDEAGLGEQVGDRASGRVKL